jgi:diguanylate cyclase (GGDEF)-like protein
MQLRYLANRFASDAPPRAPAQAPAPAFAQAPAAPATGPDARQILSSIGELVYDWDLVTDRLSWGPNLEQVLGPIASADLSTGLAFGERLSPESAASRYDAILKSDAMDEGAGVPYQAVYALSPPREFGGAPSIWVEDNGRWFKGGEDRPARAHGVVRVITERHEKDRQLARSSQFDPLTGVMNRAHLSEHIQRFLALAERNRKPFAVMLVALENLFVLNRTYGYDAGDEVIAGLAKRLNDSLRVNDLVARHAGNKFALVLDNCDNDQSKAAALRLLDAVAETPFETSAGAIPATIRVGGVIAPREGRSPQVLFQHAEEALDVARQRNGARFVAYTSSLAREDSRLRALKVADNIVSALNDRRVELAFQPIVHAANGAPAFYEALLRVRLADGSVVAPGSILPIAEKAGLVRLLDQRVMELAIKRLEEDPNLQLSVNCAMATILDPEWPDRLINAVGLDRSLAERLTVEITETSMIEDFETTRNLIAMCKRLGVKVAMDDFGAGHTSFRNLRDLAFDLVKIDGAFIQNIATSADDRFFVRTLIDLAHQLELKIVAEWVEDEETARILREWGVDYFQGALFGSALAMTAGACEPSPGMAARA